MIWWLGASLLFIFAIGGLFPLLVRLCSGLGSDRALRDLRDFGGTLQEIREWIEAGGVPDEPVWERLWKIRAPWGSLAESSLNSLRKSGGGLLPTIRRLEALSNATRKRHIEASTKLAPALTQAWICMVLVPAVSLLFFLLLPELSHFLFEWILGAVIAFLLSGIGALWMFQKAKSARRGGIPAEAESWPHLAECFSEQLSARIRGGDPPDLAWTEAHRGLYKESKGFAEFWGSSIWTAPEFPKGARVGFFGEWSRALRKTIQVGLMEGRPCLERIESLIEANRLSWSHQVQKSIERLSTSALVPLFLFVAPSILGQVGWAIYLVGNEMIEEFS